MGLCQTIPKCLSSYIWLLLWKTLTAVRPAAAALFRPAPAAPLQPAPVAAIRPAAAAPVRPAPAAADPGRPDEPDRPDVAGPGGHTLENTNNSIFLLPAAPLC